MTKCRFSEFTFTPGNKGLESLALKVRKNILSLTLLEGFLIVLKKYHKLMKNCGNNLKFSSHLSSKKYTRD